nr:hypothetical protein Iba_chr07aCG6610 [Ipomoea batatas]GMD12763.1 hypothetical protein Iba_chr07aCG6630 [Ipomoea batatas]
MKARAHGQVHGRDTWASFLANTEQYRALGHGPHLDRDPGRDTVQQILVATEQNRALGHGPHPACDPNRDMPPRPRKKSVAQRPAPAEQPPATPLHDPKNFERLQFFYTRMLFQPYVLSLDVAEEFGNREEVEAMVSLPEWRYLLMDFADDTHKVVLVEVMTTMKLPKFDGLTSSPCVQFHVAHIMFRFSPDDLSDLKRFCPVQQLTEEERDNRVANVPNIQQFWEELTDGTSVCRSCHSCSSAFLKREHKFMQYLLGHLVCGRFDATSSVNHADLFCLYGMVKHVMLHMGVVIWNLFKNLYHPRGAALYLGPYNADRVGWRRREAYEDHPNAAARVHVEASGSSSSIDFQQQVLAQLAAMNMRFDHINTRLDDMEAANAQSRAEAHAYYKWMRGHYPPQGGPPFPPFDPSSMG